MVRAQPMAENFDLHASLTVERAGQDQETNAPTAPICTAVMVTGLIWTRRCEIPWLGVQVGNGSISKPFFFSSTGNGISKWSGNLVLVCIHTH